MSRLKQKPALPPRGGGSNFCLGVRLGLEICHLGNSRFFFFSSVAVLVFVFSEMGHCRPYFPTLQKVFQNKAYYNCEHLSSLTYS